MTIKKLMMKVCVSLVGSYFLLNGSLHTFIPYESKNFMKESVRNEGLQVNPSIKITIGE